MTALFYISGGFALLVVAPQVGYYYGLVSSAAAAAVGYFYSLPMVLFFVAACIAGLA